MVMVRISETYDLSTQVNKAGLLGIHTPDKTLIQTLWSGFYTNYRFHRIVGCDVALVCAQTLPADPLQVGTEAGEIAPQDMFNPILYKAVSNDSFDVVLSRMYALNDVPNDGGDSGSISAGTLGFTPNVGSDAWDVYYGLLADPDGWKKAMPQSGLSMKGLFPIVHQVLNTYGQFGQATKADYLGESPTTAEDGTTQLLNRNYTLIKGPSMRMPRLPTVVLDGAGQTTNAEFPKTYVGCIVLPPAKLHKLYYRMRVTWTIEFMDPRPASETHDDFAFLGQVGGLSYATDYEEQSKKMTEKTDMVDTHDVAIQKIMTAGK